MKNKITKLIISAVLTLSMFSTMGLTTFAKANKSYTITYAPGILGKFDENFINKNEKAYGKANVSVSKATGSITIKVASTAVMPNAPTANDVEFKNSKNKDKYYVLTSGWQPASTKVSESETYVVQYGALVKGVEYTIRYVDAISNQDVATPTIARANAGEVMNAFAMNVNNYTFDSQAKSMKLSHDSKKNTITFYYNATVKTNVVNEEVITRVPLVTTVTNQTTTNVPVTNQTTPNNEETTINENDVPLANGDDNKEETTINENDVPLANGDELSKNNQTLYYSIGAIAVLGSLVALFIFLKKKKEHTA